jgi:PAS domain S-box-containing protein
MSADRFGFTPRAATSAAETAERRFRDLVHDIDGVVWELEPATRRFTFVSRRAEKLLGYPVERWLATQDFWSTLIDARDHERAQAVYASAARGERVVDHEFRAVAADGTVVWLRDRVHRAAGGRLRGLMIEVTEERCRRRLLGRLVSGTLELQRQPVALAQVVEAAGRAVRSEAAAKNVAIDVTLEAADVHVHGDRRRLRQVARRALEGAVRATSSGGTVAVRVARDGASALIAVSADGASAAPLRGMRFAVARRLLELHGGTATTGGGGTGAPTLTISLPLMF